MRVYDNAYPSTYEELRAISPPWQRAVLEYDAWWQMFGAVFDTFRAASVQELTNSTVDNLDAQGVADLERFFKIPARGTLADRKRAILAYYRGSGRIGGQEICDVVNAFTNGETSVELRGGTIVAHAVRDALEGTSIEPAREILRARIPAHLGLLLSDAAYPFVSDLKANFDFTFERLRMKTVYYHFINDVIFFNGEHAWDGSWYLSHGVKGGWLERLHIKLPPWFNPSTVVTRITYPVVEFDNPVEHLDKFRWYFVVPVDENREVINIPRVRMRMGFDSAERLGACTLTHDGLWPLDGSAMLDGNRKLGTSTIKEDL